MDPSEPGTELQMTVDTVRVPAGYLHPNYAASLEEFGTPRELSRSRAWLLVRPIPGSERRDAMGCYPLFCCADGAELPEDLRELDDVVSVVAVVDPSAPIREADLRRAFPDLVRPFKEHFVVDLPRVLVSRHHRQELRRAARTVRVEKVAEPLSHCDEWERLYAHLRQRL